METLNTKQSTTIEATESETIEMETLNTKQSDTPTTLEASTQMLQSGTTRDMQTVESDICEGTFTTLLFSRWGRMRVRVNMASPNRAIYKVLATASEIIVKDGYRVQRLIIECNDDPEENIVTITEDYNHSLAALIGEKKPKFIWVDASLEPLPPMLAFPPVDVPHEAVREPQCPS